jgi:hypothetical protein
MALALRLAEHGHDAERLTVASVVTLDEVDGPPTVVSSEIAVQASVPGLRREEFDAAVDEAAQLCPIAPVRGHSGVRAGGARTGVTAGPSRARHRGRPAAARLHLDRPTTIASVALGGALIVAGGVVAAVNSASPFGHGSGLAAYLVLVGGVSQVVLGVGALAVGGPSASGSRVATPRLVPWNLGSLAVPAGVLAAAAGAVTAGSAALLSSLTLFAADARAARGPARRQVFAYIVIIASLAASVVVGSALAGAAPGAWL